MKCACEWEGGLVVALCGAHEEAFREREAILAERFTAAGWRACIDHIIKTDSLCPVCEAEKLRNALEAYTSKQSMENFEKIIQVLDSTKNKQEIGV